MVRKTFFVSFFPIIVFALLMAWIISYLEGYDFKLALTNVLPLAVISSAIAIPSARNMNTYEREFVTYESSLSDIIGVVFFNFVALHEVINGAAFFEFGWQMLLILIISVLATVGLSYLLSRINHHIKFIPIMVLLILIYTISKIYHLPSLLFILLFGIALGNLDEFKRFKWIAILKPESLDKEVHKFREIAVEAAFVIRAFFFILFGYLLETSELLDSSTFLWSIGVVALIFLIRAVQLKISGVPLFPLLFVAPRGLITILLFLSIEPDQMIPIVNKSLIIQVIILTALIMMAGMFGVKKPVPETMASTDMLPVVRNSEEGS